MTDEQEFEKWWDEQSAVVRVSNTKFQFKRTFLFALAIGRKAGMEEAAEIVEGCKVFTPTPLDEQWDDACDQVVKTIRQRIEAMP